MVKACTIGERVLRHVDARIATDHPSLVEVAAINHCLPLVLSHELQRRFRDVVVACAPQHGNVGELPRYWIRSQLAQVLLPDNREFNIRWFKLGSPFLDFGPFPRTEWKADKEIFLLVVKHRSEEHCVESSYEAAAFIRRDKKFMLQVLQADGSLWATIEPELQHDFDLSLLAFSGEQLVSKVEAAVQQRR